MPASTRAAARGDDFASALLVRLVRGELARRGLLPDEARAGGGAPRVGEAHVPLAAKRALLEGVAARAGHRPLLEIGDGLPRLLAESPDDPVLAALVRAAGPRDALARWQRLERFLHARHRLVLEEDDDARGAFVVRHAGPRGAPPTAAEDALVLGVIAALCRHAGARGLTVTLLGVDGTTFRVLGARGFRELPRAWTRPGASARWRFAWTHVESPDAPPATGAAPARLSDRLAAVVARDPCRAWTLAAATRVLDEAGGPSLAPRTLQRRLAAEQASFAGVVRAARVAAAARLLDDGTLGTGVIGFACGFSDQPHFTRQFRRATGVTPAAWRAVSHRA